VVILLKTPEMQQKAELLERVLRRHGFKVRHEVIEAYNLNNVVNVCDRLIKTYKGCDVSLNITGGTKIGTIGSFLAFYNADKPIFYVDTKNSRIIKLFPEKDYEEYPVDITRSTMDYLLSYGFALQSCTQHDEAINERQDLTNFLSRNQELIKELNYHLHEYDEKRDIPVKVKIKGDDRFLKLINKTSGIVWDKGWLRIEDEEMFRYLKGGWLEEYIYLIAKSLKVDEVLLNVSGEWITSGKRKPKNEFDILISKGIRLFLISCKTSNPNRTGRESEGVGREFLYELDSLADHALGLFGKRMLASARKIEDPYIKERARVLNIDVIDGNNIMTLRENLAQWLRR